MGFFKRLFGSFMPPALPPVKDKRVWNEDWQIGDIAECIVRPDQWPSLMAPRDRLAFHSRHQVIGIDEGVGEAFGCLLYGLKLKGATGYYSTQCFRKVRPEARSAIAERILNATPGPDKVREDA